MAVVDKNGTLYNKGFGYADIKTKKPYTEHTIQNIASISKVVVGLSLLKAQEMGFLWFAPLLIGLSCSSVWN